MDTLGAFEAKTHFSALLERVAKGETFTMRLARAHALTIYDAAYLDLALRLKAPLATRDAALRRAARAAKVPLLAA